MTENEVNEELAKRSEKLGRVRRPHELIEDLTRNERRTATKDNAKAKNIRPSVNHCKGKVAPGRKNIRRNGKFSEKMMSKTSKVLKAHWARREKAHKLCLNLLKQQQDFKPFWFCFVQDELKLLEELYESPFDWVSWAAAEFDALNEFLQTKDEAL